MAAATPPKSSARPRTAPSASTYWPTPSTASPTNASSPFLPHLGAGGGSGGIGGSTMDRIIANGTVVTATETRRAAVGIRDGRIAEIGERIEAGSAEVIDATGCYVI